MIPFHLFATPQDAYEWAARNAYRCAFQRGRRGWEFSWAVHGSPPFAPMVGWATETLLHDLVHRPRRR